MLEDAVCGLDIVQARFGFLLRCGFGRWEIYPKHGHLGVSMAMGDPQVRWMVKEVENPFSING